ncbi:hypothetical protein ACQUY5_33285, partial [Bacillus cereus]
KHGRLTPELEKVGKTPPCKADGCEGKSLALGYCTKHYRQNHKYKRIVKAVVKDKICKVEGCQNPMNARGLCDKHYY